MHDRANVVQDVLRWVFLYLARKGSQPVRRIEIYPREARNARQLRGFATQGTVRCRAWSVIIYDYVDMSVPVLARMAAKRRIGYQTIGYRIVGTDDLFSDQSVASNASGAAPATFSV